MFGRNPRFPFEAEKCETDLTVENDIAELLQDVNSEVAIEKHVEQMSQMRDNIFPIVDSNIKKAQEKQQAQYQKKRGKHVCQFKDGDTVLLHNMRQKTKKGHKLEDQWNGPYKVMEADVYRGVCTLLNPLTNKAGRQQSIKNLKLYKQENKSSQTQLCLCTASKLQHPSKSSFRKQPCEEDECKIVKERKSDVSLLSKMKTPNYQFNENDEDVIIKNGLLTDIDIGKAQNLLKQQFPSMEGLQATTLGMVQQFDLIKVCHGQDPSKITFKRRNIRSHLWNCFTKGKMHMFPSVPRMSSPEQTS
ncbi:uncharacterized protein LOC124435962, partial [Xenia sp. Carnegie-2017]|uniref:uncharacterized protein LOC124435962 n=1 Tax=Xenia sp. Carnegie-2017 TaxID=2897299 RepID=UPI001F0504CC